MSSIRVRRIAVVALAALSLLLPAGAASGLGAGGYVYKVIDNQYFKTHGSTPISTVVGRGSFSFSKTQATTVGLSLGAGPAAVKAQLGYSSTTSVTMTQTCTWTTQKEHRAYPYYKINYYRIQKYTRSGTLLSTSGILRGQELIGIWCQPS